MSFEILETVPVAAFIAKRIEQAGLSVSDVAAKAGWDKPAVLEQVIQGRMKLPIAEKLRDKVLHTDALMQKADWQTGLAGILGIVGIGFFALLCQSFSPVPARYSLASSFFSGVTSASAFSSRLRRSNTDFMCRSSSSVRYLAKSGKCSSSSSSIWWR